LKTSPDEQFLNAVLAQMPTREITTFALAGKLIGSLQPATGRTVRSALLVLEKRGLVRRGSWSAAWRKKAAAGVAR
jgi:hypothetical protein